VDEESFAELVAITNLLPGPASSQLGIAIGALRAGKLGGLAAWLGFTLPAAVAMTALGLGLGSVEPGAGWLRGLELAAAAVVLTALAGMARTLTPDLPRVALAAAAAAVALLWAGVPGQVVPIAGAALVGLLAFRGGAPAPVLRLHFPISGAAAVASLAAFALLLAALPLADRALDLHALSLVDSFYRAGALVFGGGHVVLPLLQSELVAPGWVTQEQFLAGYGAVQAMPGPLFTFSAYLGAVGQPEPSGVAGAALALGAIFLPSFLVLGGVLPLWSLVRRHGLVRAAVTGIGAAVVGLLAAAFWDPILKTAVDGPLDVALGAALVVALRLAPPWLVVAGAAAVGALVL
jgi:chromate transporter